MYLTNKEYVKTAKLFQCACSLAGVEPTSRQAAKFQTRRGRAFRFYNEARKKLLDESKKSEAEKIQPAGPMAISANGEKDDTKTE